MWSPAIVLLAACYGGWSPSTSSEAPPQAEPRGEPELRIDGQWTYRVRTNECNEGTGTGMIEFTARGGDVYGEAGRVLWPDGTAIEWAGAVRYSRSARAFESTQSNSLDDEVESRWQVDRERGWLVVRWRQSNGCSGLGIATRPGAPEASFTSTTATAGAGRPGAPGRACRCAADERALRVVVRSVRPVCSEAAARSVSLVKRTVGQHRRSKTGRG